MRWSLQKAPQDGETRIVRKFAFIPTEVGQHIIWLEFYDSHQTYHADLDETNADYWVIGGAHNGWVEQYREPSHYA